jgi:hypothetical protein
VNISAEFFCAIKGIFLHIFNLWSLNHECYF